MRKVLVPQLHHVAFFELFCGEIQIREIKARWVGNSFSAKMGIKSKICWLLTVTRRGSVCVPRKTKLLVAAAGSVAEMRFALQITVSQAAQEIELQNAPARWLSARRTDAPCQTLLVSDPIHRSSGRVEGGGE